MLDRLNGFIGSTVLALIIVFGAFYLIAGNWSASDLGLQTASGLDQTPAPPVPIPQ